MTVQYTKGVDRMDDEPDMIGAEDEEAAPEQAPAESAAPLDMTPGENGTYGHEHETPPAAPAEEPETAQANFTHSEEDKKALANYEEVRANFPEEDRKARLRMSIKPDAAVTPKQARELYKTIGSMVDGAAQ